MTFTVKQARQLAGYSQVVLAEKLGIPITTYRRYEKKPDTMRVSDAKRLAEVVGLPFGQIFFRDGLPKVDDDKR
jgi:transcriptional regulator with XRE-family HTH domain